MSTARLAAVLMAATIGCHAAPGAIDPPPVTGMRAVVLAEEHLYSGGAITLPALEALDLAAPPARWLHAPEGAEPRITLTALAYRAALPDLHLPAGPLALDEGPAAIPLPAPDAVHQLELTDGTPGAWTPLPAVPDRLRALRVRSTQ